MSRYVKNICSVCSKVPSSACNHEGFCCQCFDDVIADMPKHIPRKQALKFGKIKVNRMKNERE